MDTKTRQDRVPERDATQGELQWIKHYIELSYSADSKEDRDRVKRPRKARKSKSPQK